MLVYFAKNTINGKTRFGWAHDAIEDVKIWQLHYALKGSLGSFFDDLLETPEAFVWRAIAETEEYSKRTSSLIKEFRTNEPGQYNNPNDRIRGNAPYIVITQRYRKGPFITELYPTRKTAIEECIRFANGTEESDLIVFNNLLLAKSCQMRDSRVASKAPKLVIYSKHKYDQLVRLGRLADSVNARTCWSGQPEMPVRKTREERLAQELAQEELSEKIRELFREP